ncbi:unnamed protein product [Cylicostephanus goldi]|uniref:G-protein coupled receptors family 1 profile domain-containing protein n=1 Tax=Cylicostephanus goldi TaxID=71465 RepID=A0A3P6S441_CYLGO|nr:unnamed protein product [Cylicostephanus goldi]
MFLIQSTAITNYTGRASEPTQTTLCRRDSNAVFDQSPSNLKRCVSCERRGDTPLPRTASRKLRREKSERLVNRKPKFKSPPKPKAISAAKERRGVKVLGIILGCFTVCWTPFFV